MHWTTTKPIIPGWYAWRLDSLIYPHLTRIYADGDELRADMMDKSWEHDHALQDIADREWYGPIPA
jgi:hypothetical protein